MTAGGGILHIETPPEELVVSGGLFHGFQLWVNLPAPAQDGAAPLPGHPRAAQVALLTSPDGGALLRVIAGEVAGHPGPGVTHTPITLLHATLQPGRPAAAAVAARLQRPGLRAGRVGHGRRRAASRSRTGQLAVFGAGDALTVERRPPSQESRSPSSSTCSSSAASRSASRSPRTARS